MTAGTAANHCCVCRQRPSKKSGGHPRSHREPSPQHRHNPRTPAASALAPSRISAQVGKPASRQAPCRRSGCSAPAARRRRRRRPAAAAEHSFWQRHLPAAAPNPLLPPPPHSAPRAAMASIFKLLDALPRHFGALAPNAAAAESALDVADLLKDLLNDAGPSCIASADAAGLERCS